MKAYITLLSTISYLPGVIVLHDSILRTGTSYPFWVAVSAIIPSDVEDELKGRGMHVVRLNSFATIPVSFREKSGHWANTFDKIQLFGLTDFSKLVYVDSDMMVLNNIDELFEKNHLSAVAAGQLEHPDWTRLNSGLMVISPEHQLPEKIINTINRAMHEVTALGSNKIGDQDVINAYYPDWPSQADLHLDQGYNIFFSDLDAYILKHGYKMPSENMNSNNNISVIHFVGSKKPWMKWARIKHFFDTLKSTNSSRWEKRAFSMYYSKLKKMNLI